MPRQKLATQPVTFKVVFEPDGGGWHVTIPSVKGCHSWGQSLGQARRNIREALACCVDVFGTAEQADAAAASAVFAEDVKLPPTARAAVQRHKRAQLTAARARKDSTESAKALAKELSLRDAGELLGMSPEGVRKLMKAS
jgi:predicted RNase H-like HicB family nuclease